MSSGIGYSIANKKPSDWDNMESHVVKQMKRFYPSFFASDSDIKATFNELSQIDDIRKDYLDGEFVKNRDKIISSKVNSYFGNATSEIKAILSDGKANLNERNNALCKKDISQDELSGCCSVCKADVYVLLCLKSGGNGQILCLCFRNTEFESHLFAIAKGDCIIGKL